MQRESIHEEYSYDRLYRFIVCRESDYFEVWVQKKVIDEYLNPDEIYYSDIPDIKHTADSLERAIEIGQECLNNLSPKPQRETCKTIELTGTREERWQQAVRLAYTDVTDEEMENFHTVYKEAGIKILPSAEELFKKYGGTFRTLRPIFSQDVCTSEFEWGFTANLAFVKWAGRGEAIGRLKEMMEEADEVREFAGQEVCPVGMFGYYYPPEVYVGKDGRLYCVYDYTDQISVFNTPEEIVKDQIGDDLLRLESR